MRQGREKGIGQYSKSLCNQQAEIKSNKVRTGSESNGHISAKKEFLAALLQRLQWQAPKSRNRPHHLQHQPAQ